MQSDDNKMLSQFFFNAINFKQCEQNIYANNSYKFSLSLEIDQCAAMI